MFLNDFLQNLWRARVVPGPFGIDDSNRPPFADPKAIGLGPVNTSLVHQFKLLQTPLEILPRLQAVLFGTAMRLRLVAAEEDVAADARNSRLIGETP